MKSTLLLKGEVAGYRCSEDHLLKLQCFADDCPGLSGRVYDQILKLKLFRRRCF